MEEWQEAKKTNSLAIWSLVSGVLGISVLPFVGSFAALLLGYVANLEIDESDGELGGRELARIGIIIGWIGVGILALLICAFWAAYLYLFPS